MKKRQHRVIIKTSKGVETARTMKTELQFALDDQLLGENVSPDNISLPMLEEFVQQVMQFVKGSSKINLKNLKTEIRQGSFAIAVVDELGELEDVKKDYIAAASNNDLSLIDPVRRQILIEWQRSVLKNKDRKYKLKAELPDEKKSDVRMVIDSSSKFHFHKEIWFDVEEYVYGRIYDLGGKTKSNVHIELSDGTSIKAETNPNTLLGDKENRIYREQLLRLKAKRNITNGETKDHVLLSYENYNSEYNQDKYEKLIANGRKAWGQIPNPIQWLEMTRGYDV